MSEDKEVVIALVKITEPTPDGKRQFPNGTVFETTIERAKFYKDSGFARKPTEEEMQAYNRLPRAKGTTTRQMTPQEPPTEKEQEQEKAPQDSKTATKGRPALGRYNRRDQQAS